MPVVDEDVEPAEGLHGYRAQRGRVAYNVAARRSRTFVRERLDGCAVARVEHHGGAGFVQPPRDPAADRAAGAGHERSASAQIEQAADGRGRRRHGE